MKFAFDLDGVLANSLHRAKDAPDWDLFYSKIPGDKPILETIEIVRLLRTRNKIIFITGRPERTRKITENWLRNYLQTIPYQYTLVMRKDGSNEPNPDTKLKMCREVKPDLVFEDDEETAQALYDNGFKVMLFLRDKEFARNRKSTEQWVKQGGTY